MLSKRVSCSGQENAGNDAAPSQAPQDPAVLKVTCVSPSTQYLHSCIAMQLHASRRDLHNLRAKAHACSRRTAAACRPHVLHT